MSLNIEEEKQVITKKDARRDLNLKANMNKARDRMASTEIE